MPDVTSSSVEPLALRLETLREQLLAMDEAATLEFFNPGDFKLLLKSTISLCPECLAHVPALIFTRGGQALMRKRCNHHGFSEALIESDESFYHLSNKDRWGRRFAEERVIDFPAFTGSCCSDGNCAEPNNQNFAGQMTNKSCTILVEVTNA
jgi:uncharacterized radical SAM superfamily Fe-S cluster-containing enzyme